MMNLVKRFVHGQIENKRSGRRVVDAAFNSIIGSASECYPILPTVAPNDGVGTGGNERIGDKIKPRTLIVKGTIMYDAGAQENYIPPSTVRCLILSQKSIKVSSKVQTEADVSHLLKDNIGTDVARYYNSSPYDNLAPINTDLFRVHMDKKFKMRAQIEKQMGNNNTVLGYATQQPITFSVKIKCPATLTYDDGNGSDANNFAPFFCFGAVNDDGSTGWSLNSPYRVRVLSVLDFEDA